MSFDLSSRSSSVALGLSVVLVSIYVVRTIRYRATHKLPPGPKGIPFFGNLFQLSRRPWNEFEMWRKKYDSLMYITVAGTGILVLNSHKAATELLEHRGHIYSDRPRFIMANELLSSGLAFAITRYGEVCVSSLLSFEK
jgi:hypothetical protein